MELLKKLRTEKGLSQKEVAKALNISQSMYCYYETGASEPTASIIKRICIFFEISADYLLGLELIDGRKIYNITNNFY